MAAITVALLSFIFGYALDRIMNEDGFGPTGNMFIMTAGFFLGIYAANLYGVHFRHLDMGVGAGVLSGFITLTILTLFKALLNRLRQ
jgi:hypothetical protein